MITTHKRIILSQALAAVLEDVNLSPLESEKTSPREFGNCKTKEKNQGVEQSEDTNVKENLEDNPDRSSCDLKNNTCVELCGMPREDKNIAREEFDDEYTKAVQDADIQLYTIAPLEESSTATSPTLSQPLGCQNLRGLRILDVGSGTGHLGIMAALFGAEEVFLPSF